MSKHTIEELRNHLFAALEGLRDAEKPMELDRAKAIADVAQVVINSAKVEVDYAKATGSAPGSGFLHDAPPLPEGITGVKVHRLKG